MAEIKSAIEIAMERTKGLVMDEREKREFAARDLDERLKAVVRRFLEGIVGREEFVAECDRVTAPGREKIRRLVEIAAGEFGPAEEKERVFDLFEVVGGQIDRRLAEEARSLADRFADELKRNTSGVRKEVLARLSQMGISGDSLEPNVEEWEEWKEALGKTGSLFEGPVAHWKERALEASA